MPTKQTKGVNNSTMPAKGSTHYAQKQTFFQYLQTNIATCSMATAATGIPQKSLTRYKRQLEKAGRLWEIIQDACKITGCKAWYLTTDENKSPDHPSQLKMFNNG